MWDSRTLTITYLRWEVPHEVTHVVEPHGLVVKAGRWYLIARSRAGMRTYRVSRILSAEPTGQSFEPAPDFRVTAYWESHLARFTSRNMPNMARLLVSPTAFHRLPRGWRIDDETVGDDGWYEAEMPYATEAEAVHEILGLGTEAVVLRPHAVRAAVESAVRLISRRYGVTPADDVDLKRQP